jgi:D-alanyl-D-alanine endopeptidase (penicillin-binding protein 7)
LRTIALALAACCALTFSVPASSSRHDTKPSAKAKLHKATSHQQSRSHVDPVGLRDRLRLSAFSVLVLDEREDQPLYEKNVDAVHPIASITKLMTAMVTLDSATPVDESVTIEEADVDTFKHTGSRLPVGATLTRYELLHLALMSSENRAAAALTRTSLGGREAFIQAMNRKALELGMANTHFVEGTGLSRRNVSTASDLAKMVRAAHQYPLIREFTTQASHYVTLDNGRTLEYHNSNGLVRGGQWEIGLSKTGYIAEAGRCLVMQARIAARAVVIVLLHASDTKARAADANQIKKWIERTNAMTARST